MVCGDVVVVAVVDDDDVARIGCAGADEADVTRNRNRSSSRVLSVVSSSVVWSHLVFVPSCRSSSFPKDTVWSWVGADDDGTALNLSPRTTIRCTSFRSRMSRAGRRSLGKRQCNVSSSGFTLASSDAESPDRAFCGAFGWYVLCVLGGPSSAPAVLR